MDRPSNFPDLAPFDIFIGILKISSVTKNLKNISELEKPIFAKYEIWYGIPLHFLDEWEISLFILYDFLELWSYSLL